MQGPSFNDLEGSAAVEYSREIQTRGWGFVFPLDELCALKPLLPLNLHLQISEGEKKDQDIRHVP
jgi:hypothetical protein